MANVITGTAGNDNIVGTAGHDWLDGGEGNDSLRGGGGDDTLEGGDGADDLRGQLGRDLLRGGGGDDLLIGQADDDTLEGGNGDDGLFGEVGDDVLLGGAGDDVLRGEWGLDVLHGGDGFDRVSLFHPFADRPVAADLRTGMVYDDGYGNAEVLVSIEALGGGTRFADSFHGDDAANLLSAGTADTAESHGGDDEFWVSGAPALVDGGDGVDTISLFLQTRLRDVDGDGVGDLEATGEGVIVDLARGRILDDGFGDSGVVRNVENLGGSPYGDALTGDRRRNELAGHDGNDTLTGGKGDDWFVYDGFYGFAGHDVVTDFKPKQDQIVFRNSDIDSFEDLVITDVGKHVLITWGAGGASILLENTQPQHISPEDFLFG